jgi:hypothetical protein
MRLVFRERLRREVDENPAECYGSIEYCGQRCSCEGVRLVLGAFLEEGGDVGDEGGFTGWDRHEFGGSIKRLAEESVYSVLLV